MAYRPGTELNFRWDGVLLVVGFLLAGAVAVLWFLPSAPRSVVGWASVVAVGPLVLLALVVLQVLGEGATELLCRVPPVRALMVWLDAVTAGRRFSLLRVGVALIPVSLLLGLLALVTLLVNQAPTGKETGVP